MLFVEKAFCVIINSFVDELSKAYFSANKINDFLAYYQIFLEID